MAKIAVIGLIGTSTFMCVDHFHEKGETLIAHSVFNEVGGKGSNQAIAAARMGAEVTFLAAIGDDEGGKECLQVAQKNGVTPVFKVKEGKATTFAFILTDKNGENRVTEFEGAELCPEDVLDFEKQIAECDILLLQHEVPDVVNAKAVELAVKYQKKIILNPAPAREGADRYAEHLFAVTPNEQEVTLLDKSKFKNCITTLGSEGCDINGKIKILAIKVKAVDTTGAGDTFNGVLAVCLAEGMNMETACRYAVTASGISVGGQYVINTIPYRKDIELKLQ